MSLHPLRYLIIACLLSAAAFGQETGAGAADEKSWLPVLGSVHETYVRHQVEGYALSDGTIHVTVHDEDGSILFESRYPVDKTDGKYLEWQYYGTPNYAHSTRFDDKEVPTLQSMTIAAKDILRMMKTNPPFLPAPDARSGPPRKIAPNDDYGCDSIAGSITCTSNGNCCDQHDQCYFAFGCDASSWLGSANPLCTACNEAVVACIVFGVNNTGQPSECCARGDCGNPRPPGGGFGGDPYYQDWQSAGGYGGNSGGWTGGGSGGSGGSTTSGWCRFPDGQILPCG